MLPFGGKADIRPIISTTVEVQPTQGETSWPTVCLAKDKNPNKTKTPESSFS